MGGVELASGLVQAFAGLSIATLGTLAFLRNSGSRMNRGFFWYAIAYASVAAGYGLVLAAQAMFPGATANQAYAAAIVPVLIFFGTYACFWLRFCAVALPGPILGWAGGERIQRLLLLGGFLVVPITWAWYRTGRIATEDLLYFWSYVLFAIALSVLVASIYAWKQTEPNTEARRRARAYSLAFAGHDLAWMVYLSYNIGTHLGFFDQGYLAHLLLGTTSVVLFWFVPLLMYGMFSGQLLHFDSKLRVGVSGTFAVAIISVVFLTTTELIEQLFTWNNPFTAVLAAVAVALAFQPIQRAAHRLTFRFFPDQKPASHMNRSEKLQLYREHIALAIEDGMAKPRDSKILHRLSGFLVLTPEEIDQLHTEFE